MRNKVLKIANELSIQVSEWKGIESVILGEAAEIEIYDPYFIIDLDVLYRGHLPPANDRKTKLGDPSGYESSPVYLMDSFFIDELPVRIYYIDTTRIELILERIEKGNWAYREGSTNMFYRIIEGEVLYKKSEWLNDVKKRLNSIPDSFWTKIMDSAKCRLAAILGELGASAYRKDSLFFTISAANFLKVFLSFLFAANKSFEPSGRMLFERVKELERLPDGFQGRLESFLRNDTTFDLEKKHEIAELLVKNIIAWP